MEEYLSIVKIANPNNSTHVLTLTMNQPIQSESQFLCDVIQVPHFFNDELTVSARKSFEQTCSLGDKENAKVFWDSLSQLSHDNLDSIENLNDYIKKIQQIGSFSKFILTLPLPTLRGIIFTLVKRNSLKGLILLNT